MNDRPRIKWRSHLPLLLFVAGAFAFLGIVTAAIIHLNSIPQVY